MRKSFFDETLDRSCEIQADRPPNVFVIGRAAGIALYYGGDTIAKRADEAHKKGVRLSDRFFGIEGIMPGTMEILVSGGVAAVLAAAIGGGLRAFSVEVPLMASPRRQALLFGVGVLLIAAGIWMGPRPERPPPRPVPPTAVVSGMTVIDFRASSPEEPGGGYLLVTTDLAVRNATEPGHSLTWTGTAATLRIGGATIPFRADSFTTLTNEQQPWLGVGRTAAGPEAIRAGAVVPHEVMFMPANTGSGRYAWLDFLRAVTRNGEANPVFEINVATAIGEAEGPPATLRCIARVDELMPTIRVLLAERATNRWITADCSR